MTLDELINDLTELRSHYNGTLDVILTNEHLVTEVEYNDDVEPCILILTDEE